jgi:hypothetical protein
MKMGDRPKESGLQELLNLGRREPEGFGDPEVRQRAFDDALQREIVNPLVGQGFDTLGPALGAGASAFHELFTPQIEDFMVPGVGQAKKIGKNVFDITEDLARRTLDEDSVRRSLLQGGVDEDEIEILVSKAKLMPPKEIEKINRQVKKDLKKQESDLINMIEKSGGKLLPSEVSKLRQDNFGDLFKKRIKDIKPSDIRGRFYEVTSKEGLVQDLPRESFEQMGIDPDELVKEMRIEQIKRGVEKDKIKRNLKKGSPEKQKARADKFKQEEKGVNFLDNKKIDFELDTLRNWFGSVEAAKRNIRELEDQIGMADNLSDRLKFRREQKAFKNAFRKREAEVKRRIGKIESLIKKQDINVKNRSLKDTKEVRDGLEHFKDSKKRLDFWIGKFKKIKRDKN